MKGNEGKAGTVLLILILILIMIAAGLYGYLYVTKIENRLIVLENNQKSSQVEQNVLEAKDASISNSLLTEEEEPEDKIETAIKNYILNDFGPKNNMKEVTVIGYEETTAEKYLSAPSGDVTEEEIEEFKTENPNAYYGYCIYTIQFKNVNSVVMEGSQSTVQKTVGDTMVIDAYFTYNKLNQKVEFSTSYGFGK